MILSHGGDCTKKYTTMAKSQESYGVYQLGVYGQKNLFSLAGKVFSPRHNHLLPQKIDYFMFFCNN